MSLIARIFRESWRLSLWLIGVGAAMTIVMVWAYEWRLVTAIKVGALNICFWLVLWIGNGYLSDWLDHKISWHERPGTRFAAGIVTMLAYTLASVWVLVVFFREVVGLDAGSGYSTMLYCAMLITILISMFMTSRSFLFNWRQAAVDAEQLKRESVRAQYESLRNQVNPHFLFNSLNALSNLVYQDPDKAARFIKQLSEVYRYVLDTRDREVVKLEEELEFLKAYFFLQQIRFGEKLKMDVQVVNRDGSVAPLALQMLVENAIKHNIIADAQPLSVRVTERDGRIWVSNTLQKRSTPGEEGSGLGLDNIRRRYSFLSGKPVEVITEEGVFSVGLPVLPPQS